MPGHVRSGRLPAQAHVGPLVCAPPTCEHAGSSQQGPAIFWPCGKESPIPPPVPRHSPPLPRELQELRDENRDLNDWLKAELQLRFSEVERKLDLLDLTHCLQERILAQFSESEKKIDAISSHLSRCEASISALSQTQRVPRTMPSAMNMHQIRSEYTVATQHSSMGDIPEGARRGSLFSMESLQNADGLFRKRSPCAETISRFLEDPESSKAAYWYATLWPMFVMVSAVSTLLQSWGQTFWHGLRATVSEVTIDSIFAVEFFLRYMACPCTWGFMKIPYSIIDFSSVLPLVLRAVVGFTMPQEGPARYVLICVVPLLRLLKMLRWLKQFHLFARVLDDTKEALKFLLFMLLIIVVLFASLFFLVEPQTTVESLPQAMWLTIVTVTTVGYATPETGAGHFVVTALLISSVLYMAMPIGILGNAFTEVWKDRDLILLASRTSDRLAEWGYTPKDIPHFFQLFDTEGKGELSVLEFRRLLDEMRVGLSEERVVEVFDQLDKDGGGSIDCKEFLKMLFPSTYYEMYGSKRTKKARSHRQKHPRHSSDSSQSATPSLQGSPTFASAHVLFRRTDSRNTDPLTTAGSSCAQHEKGAPVDGHPVAKVHYEDELPELTTPP